MKKFLRFSGSALVVMIVMLACTAAMAQDNNTQPAAGSNALGYLGAGVGAGLVAVGAGLGIGRLAGAAAEGTARQPSAASSITGAVQLPLFLLEGTAIIGLVVCLLIVLTK